MSIQALIQPFIQPLAPFSQISAIISSSANTFVEYIVAIIVIISIAETIFLHLFLII